VDHERSQLADLATIGLDWDGEVVRQSDRFDRYEAAIDVLAAAGLTYPCWCTRREIREAVAAPHVDAEHSAEGAYPGTCRDLSAAQRRERAASDRPAALRLRSDGRVVTVPDDVLGEVAAVVDDVVLRRNDGVPAYNLAVVVDDAAQGIDEVCRGDDLLASAPRQALLQDLLGLPRVVYAHVPLVVGDDGERLAKRHGAVTLEDLAPLDPQRVVAALARSLGVPIEAPAVSAADVLAVFDAADLAAAGWVPVALADLRRSWS
jgi:glutamyl-tRNA synthetase